MNFELPYFVVIGAMKAGTTSLHHYLDLHPELSMPVNGKELNFFNRDSNYNKGIEWYKNNFELNQLKKGEVCPQYSMFPYSKKVPERMHSIIPNAGLIYILRDPIERFLSQIHHQYIDGRETRSINEIVDDESDKWNYRSYSMYYRQIEQFLPFYDRNKILIITLEQLSYSPEVTLKKIFEFLDVDPCFYVKSYEKKYHVSTEKKSHGRLLRTINSNKIPAPLIELKKNLAKRLPNDIYFFLRKKMLQDIQKPVLDASQIRALIRDFEHDVDALRDFTGMSFDEWKYDY